MILVCVLDGLRPDLLTRERMPFLAALADEDSVCRPMFSSFPSSTRVSASTMATGCYPAKHGMVDNSIWLEGILGGRVVGDDWETIALSMKRISEPVLSAPSVATLLHRHGFSVATLGAGSTGTTHLVDPACAGPVVHWTSAWPRHVLRGVVKELGGFPSKDSSGLAKSEYVLEAAIRYVLPVHRPDVLIIWLTEPDDSFHLHGLSSERTVENMRTLDELIRRFLASLESLVGDASLTSLFLSDHGMSTVVGVVDVAAELEKAGFAPGSRIHLAANSIWCPGKQHAAVLGLADFLRDQAWIGALCGKESYVNELPWLIPNSAVFAAHPRAADLMFSFSWDRESAAGGVPGRITGSGETVADHGTASPYDMKGFLLARGAGVIAGARPALPTGLVDIAPTILHMLGVPPPENMDGRVLTELLRSTHAESWEHTHPTLRFGDAFGGDCPVQEVALQIVGTTAYLEHAGFLQQNAEGEA